MPDFEYQPPSAAYQRPWLTITANFTASDGSCPESLEIAFADPIPDPDIAGALIERCVQQLADIARSRYYPANACAGGDPAAAPAARVDVTMNPVGGEVR